MKKRNLLKALLSLTLVISLASCGTKKPANTTSDPVTSTPIVTTDNPVTSTPVTDPVTSTPVTDPVTSTPNTEIIWGEPTYTWSDDYNQCTAKRISLNVIGLEQTLVSNSTSEKQDASCLEEGLVIYTAEFADSVFETQTKEVVIPALGHVYDNDNDTTCNVCGETREQNNNYFVASVGKKTYNRSNQGLEEGEDFNVSFGTSTVYYKLKDADDSTYTETAPIYAGEYTARIVVEETAAYKGIDETVDFSIAKKKLSNIVIERKFGPGTTASYTGNGTTGWGIISGDFVTVKVTTNADYGTVAYAGDNKEVIAAEITYDPTNSYELPELSEIVFNITKEKINLSNGPTNKSSYDNIWAGTGSSIPRLNFNIGYAGNKADAWSAEDKIEKWDGSNWVSIGTDYSQQASYASANVGKYKISTKITCYQNYEIEGSDSYSLEFETKEVVTLSSANEKVSINAGEEKVFFIPVTSSNLYDIGSNLGNATVEVYTRDGYGIYNTKLNKYIGDIYKPYYTKLLIKVKADTAITNKSIAEDVSYSHRIKLTSGDNYVSTSGGAGKWVEYYFTEDDFGTGDFDVVFERLGNYVYIDDEEYYDLELVEDACTCNIWSQGGEVSILVYLENDITNGYIHIESV